MSRPLWANYNSKRKMRSISTAKNCRIMPASIVEYMSRIVSSCVIVARNGFVMDGVTLLAVILSTIWLGPSIKRSLCIRMGLWGRLFWSATAVGSEMSLFWGLYLPKLILWSCCSAGNPVLPKIPLRYCSTLLFIPV